MTDSWAGPWTVNWSKAGEAFYAQTVHPAVKVCETKDTTSSDSAVSSSSICNASELLNWLGGDSQRFKDDAALLHHVYKQRGIDGMHRVDGDFAAAIWDEDKREMHCVRDHFGQRPLFYVLNEQLFLFASDINLLLAHPNVQRKPNLQALASLNSDPAGKLAKDRTFFDGIKSVLPASVLSVSLNGIKQQSYWSVNSISIERGISEADRLCAIQDRFSTAVTSRIPSSTPAIALLSGGLDSSGIVAVAAKHLGEQDRKLVTLSAIKESRAATGLVEEESYIDCFSNIANIDLRLLRSSARGPFDNIESTMANSSEPMISSRHYLYTEFAEEVSKLGGYSVMDGRFGEYGLTYNGTGIMLEWLMRGRWVRLFHEIAATASVRDSNVWAIIRSQILRLLLKPSFQPQATGNLINKEFVETYGAVGTSAPPLKAKAFDHRALQLQYLSNAQKSSRVGGFEGYKKMHFCQPYLDRRLLEMCVSAPANLKQRNGYDRYLVRAILKNSLPESIRLRTTKAPFSVDYQQRYDRQLNVAKEFVNAIGSKDPVRNVVNVNLLEKLVARDDVRDGGRKRAHYAMHFVPSAIYSIAFLRQFSEFR